MMQALHCEDFCMRKQRHPPKDLFSQGLHEGLKKASAALEQLISDVPNITLQMLFENIVRKAGI